MWLFYFQGSNVWRVRCSPYTSVRTRARLRRVRRCPDSRFRAPCRGLEPGRDSRGSAGDNTQRCRPCRDLSPRGLWGPRRDTRGCEPERRQPRGALGDGGSAWRLGVCGPPCSGCGFGARGERWVAGITGRPSSGPTSCGTAGEAEADRCSKGC